MAKKSKSIATQSASPAVASAVTAKADIDDIFAKPSAPVSKPAITAEQTNKDTTAETTKSKKKKKSKTATSEAIEEATQPKETVESTSKAKSTKRKAPDAVQPESVNPVTPAPEVAVFSDPSATSTKKQKTAVSGKGKSKEQMQQEDEEERAFRDSRGDGPRESNFLLIMAPQKLLWEELSAKEIGFRWAENHPENPEEAATHADCGIGPSDLYFPTSWILNRFTSYLSPLMC